MLINFFKKKKADMDEKIALEKAKAAKEQNRDKPFTTLDIFE